MPYIIAVNDDPYETVLREHIFSLKEVAVAFGQSDKIKERYNEFSIREVSSGDLIRSLLSRFDKLSKEGLREELDFILGVASIEEKRRTQLETSNDLTEIKEALNLSQDALLNIWIKLETSYAEDPWEMYPAEAELAKKARKKADAVLGTAHR